MVDPDEAETVRQMMANRCRLRDVTDYLAATCPGEISGFDLIRALFTAARVSIQQVQEMISEYDPHSPITDPSDRSEELWRDILDKYPIGE